MKKILGLITIVATVTTLGYFLYHISINLEEKKATAKRIEYVPDFNLIATYSTYFSKKDLQKDKATVFIFFNSECDFCQHEAESIHEELHKFEKVQFLFISSEPVDAIQSFASHYQLNIQPNITFLHDNNSLLSTELDIASIPTVIIYDASQKLLKKHNGQLNASGILKVIHH